MTKNPIELFSKWFGEAQSSGMVEPNAVNLATASKDGRPSNRMVLMKDFDENGFVFFTNLESKKGQNIKENPYVSMCFYWPGIDKQVRIEGKVEAVSNQEADDYFESRPLNSRIGAIISKQSQPIEEDDFNLFKNSVLNSFKLLATSQVKRPDNWSGFRLVPDMIEFWQRGDFRIHKRILFNKNKNNQWDKSFLYP